MLSNSINKNISCVVGILQTQAFEFDDYTAVKKHLINPTKDLPLALKFPKRKNLIAKQQIRI